MGEIIQFKKESEPGALNIFWCDYVRKSDGVRLRIDLLKHKEYGDIAIGLTENYTEDDDKDTFTPGKVIILCDDKDNSVYDEIKDFIGD